MSPSGQVKTVVVVPPSTDGVAEVVPPVTPFFVAGTRLGRRPRRRQTAQVGNAGLRLRPARQPVGGAPAASKARPRALGRVVGVVGPRPRPSNVPCGHTGHVATVDTAVPRVVKNTTADKRPPRRQLTATPAVALRRQAKPLARRGLGQAVQPPVEPPAVVDVEGVEAGVAFGPVPLGLVGQPVPPTVRVATERAGRPRVLGRARVPPTGPATP